MADRRFTCDELPGREIEAATVEAAAEIVRDALGLPSIGVGSQYRDGRWLFWAGENFYRPVVLREVARG